MTTVCTSAADDGAGHSRRSAAPGICYLLDIFPTLCDLAGQPVPASVEGVSLAPTLSDAANHPYDICILRIVDLQNNTEHCTVMDKRYKLIEIRVGSDFTLQLFDLQNDLVKLQPGWRSCLCG